MFDKLSQEELEQPAKVYQVEALRNDIASISDKLNVIVNNTANNVSASDLEKAVRDRKDCVREEIGKINTRIDNEVKIINTRIDNDVTDIKKFNYRTFWTMIGVCASIVTAIIVWFLGIK